MQYVLFWRSYATQWLCIRTVLHYPGAWQCIVLYIALFVCGCVVCVCCGYSRAVPSPWQSKQREGDLYLLQLQFRSNLRMQVWLHSCWWTHTEVWSWQEVVRSNAAMQGWVTVVTCVFVSTYIVCQRICMSSYSFILRVASKKMGMWVFRLLQLYRWYFISAGMLHYVTGWLISNILRQHSGLVFNGPNVHEEWTFQALKMRPLCCLRMVATNYPVTWHHIPE